MPDGNERLKAALADRYELKGEIGHGGMATVYLARDLRHDSTVAVKVLRPELAASLGGMRFTREVQITANLQHPHILPLLDSGEADGLPYYVMPFVEGESLAQRLTREQRLPVEEAVRLVAEVADGLAYAHARGFVHRDIKPGNILLSHGHAIVADFGVARALEVTGAERITDSGLALGTVHYMSPEQAGGDKVDGRSDIYALGCVLYEALAGTPPFTGPSGQAIMARHAIDPVPSIRTVRPGLPQALEDAVHKALAKVPEDRFTSAAEFRDEILRAATMPVTAAQPLRLSRPWWRTRRAAAVGFVVVAAAGGVAAALKLKGSAPTLDANRVMVYPMVLPGDWKGAATAGEDIATVIGSAMDGVGSLRWVDGWQQLSPAQRRDIRLLGNEEAMEIARGQRSRFAITGRVVPTRGDSANIFLELHDVQGDTLLARAEGSPTAQGESWRGGLRAITQMLPKLIPTVAPDIEAEWRARPPQAVAHFLLGEGAFRRVQLAEALAQFKGAIEEDSTFGIAAVRGAQVATWLHRPGEAASLVRVAQRQELSPRNRFFAEGVEAYLDGRTDSAVSKLRAAIALDSSMVAAWTQLGEVYMHLLPGGGSPDSMAEAAFLRARGVDSAAATLQFHLIEIRARRGDHDGAAALARQFASASADTQLTWEAQLVASCGSGGFTGVDPREAAQRRPLALVLAGKSLANSPPTMRCAGAAYDALLLADTALTGEADGRRFFALLGLTSLALARGKIDEVVASVERFRERWGYGASVYLLMAPVEPALADRAREVARQDSVDFGPAWARVRFPVRLWELGVWAAQEGRADLAAAVARDLAGRAVAGTRLDTLLASSMEAHATLAAGDTLLARQRFQRLIAAPAPKEDITWNEAASLGFDRLVLGRLLLSAGDHAGAIQVLEVHDSALPAVFPLYLKASLTLRADAATALGQPALAAALRRRIAALSDG